MNFIADALLDQWLLEDIPNGDVTTRALGIGFRNGRMRFIHRTGGCVSGITYARRLLLRLGIRVESAAEEGEVAKAGGCLLSVTGRADALHLGWKAAQNLLAWSCGITDYTYRMTQLLQQRVPQGKIAGSRKTFPGGRMLAQQALLAGGGIIHRAGLSETILLFANHRRFLPDPAGWSGAVARLRHEAPEKTIILEVDNKEEALAALTAGADILQLDKFAIADIHEVRCTAARVAPACRLALTGGITLETLGPLSQTGIGLMVTSTPYAADPADITAIMEPAS